MATASAPQLRRVNATLNEDGETATVAVVWRVKTLDGPVEVTTTNTAYTVASGGFYSQALDMYDDAVATLTAAPYSLTLPDPPTGKLRHGYPEDAP